jgi:transposase
LPDGLSDEALVRLILGVPAALGAPPKFVPPDYPAIHQELKRKGVTLQLLWHEYRERHGPATYAYSQFCDLYRRWRQNLRRSMRQIHPAGEKLFVDYAGQTVPITDPLTGEIVTAQIFVAVLGCSNYTFAEATLSQRLADWLGSHVRAFEFMGGTPAVVVPDYVPGNIIGVLFPSALCVLASGKWRGF